MNKNRLLNISVIGFFTILIATAVPAFARSSSNAAKPWTQQERFVVNALKQIYAAQSDYNETQGPGGGFATLATLADEGRIDQHLGAGRKFGYLFDFQFSPSSGSRDFRISAVPERYGKNGRRSFYFDGTCIVRGGDKNGAPATLTDPIVEICTPTVALRNEAYAIQGLIDIYNAELRYAAENNAYTIDLWSLYLRGWLSNWLATFHYRGYGYSVSVAGGNPSNPMALQVRAVPWPYGVSGFRSFYINVSGVLRGADLQGQLASHTSPRIFN